MTREEELELTIEALCASMTLLINSVSGIMNPEMKSKLEGIVSSAKNIARCN